MGVAACFAAALLDVSVTCLPDDPWRHQRTVGERVPSEPQGNRRRGACLEISGRPRTIFSSPRNRHHIDRSRNFHVSRCSGGFSLPRRTGERGICRRRGRALPSDEGVQGKGVAARAQAAAAVKRQAVAPKSCFKSIEPVSTFLFLFLRVTVCDEWR